jgi:phosphoenolpyruvate carboxylase
MLRAATRTAVRWRQPHSLPLRLVSPFSTGEANTTTPLPKALRADVKMLGQFLGEEIKRDAKCVGVYEHVEKLRLLGREWRVSADGKNGNTESELAFKKMVEHVGLQDNNTLHGIARAFTHFLALSNSAENQHRARRNREKILSAHSETALSVGQDSSGSVIESLRKDKNVSPEKIVEHLSTQMIEIVMTAHPTEVNRRTNLLKYERVRDLLRRHDQQESMTAYEQRELTEALRREVASIWGSDELTRSKPTPVEEARAGLAVVENVLWTAVPTFLRKLDADLQRTCGASLPLDASPIKFSSWMGGDRDGNPNVTPIVTLEVSLMARWTAADLFRTTLREMQSELSLHAASDELLGKVHDGCKEPYREILRGLGEQLDATLAWTARELRAIRGGVAEAPILHTAQPLIHSSELLEPLMLIHRSLCASGYANIADGSVKDTIRRVQSFGLSLLPLDIRQDSAKHTEALDAITQHLQLGAYSEWPEERRVEWLREQLASKRPLLHGRKALVDYGFSATVIDTLETFRLLATTQESSFGAYVISQCQHVSDILAVLLLQGDAGMTSPLRVVPLFETLDDLVRAPSTVQKLFQVPEYMSVIDGRQEVMVGYSDSAKDAGRLAASWAQYQSQVSMADIGEKAGVKLTFFHGKGGTVGRGGNPALFRAILAHPPHTVNGRFRITEQGEMISQNFGQVTVAERTLDIMTAAVLAEQFTPRPAPTSEWMQSMDRISESSCAVYRRVVKQDPRFVPYFKTSTPEQELGGLNVGSRPAKRNPKGGVESLRAIPWNFSWTQTRLNLPTWLGVSESLRSELTTNPAVIKDMQANWPWFATIVDLLDLICAKSDARIAQNYDDQLVPDSSSKELGSELRGMLENTKTTVLEVSGTSQLQEGNELLRMSLLVRNPYVDPLNIIQAEVLKRIRDDAGASSDADEAVMRDTLMITINGIANGMRNSG